MGAASKVASKGALELWQLARDWFGSRGAIPTASKLSIETVTTPEQAAVLKSYTGKSSQALNRHLSLGNSAELDKYAAALGMTREEYIAAMQGAVSNSKVLQDGPTFSGLMSPRYTDMLKKSDELPVYLSTSPNIQTATGFSGSGLAGFKGVGNSGVINPSASHAFGDELEAILAPGRPLKMLDYDEIGTGAMKTPMMLFEKEGGPIPFGAGGSVLTALRDSLSNPAWLKQEAATEIARNGANSAKAQELIKLIKSQEAGKVQMPDLNQLQLTKDTGAPFNHGAYGSGPGVTPEQAFALRKNLTRVDALPSPLKQEQLPLQLQGAFALPTAALGLKPEDKSVMDLPPDSDKSTLKGLIDDLLEGLKDPLALPAWGIGASGNAYAEGGPVKMGHGGVLGSVYSTADAFKRGLKDFASHPLDYLRMMDDRAKNYNENVSPEVSNGSLHNRPLTEEEKQQKAMDIALSVGPMGAGILHSHAPYPEIIKGRMATTPLYENPTVSEMARLRRATEKDAEIDGGVPAVRALRDLATPDTIYAWDGNKLLHNDVGNHLGLDKDGWRGTTILPEYDPSVYIEWLKKLPQDKKASGGSVQSPAEPYPIHAIIAQLREAIPNAATA